MTGAGCMAHQEKSHQMTTPLSSVTCPGGEKQSDWCRVHGASGEESPDDHSTVISHLPQEERSKVRGAGCMAHQEKSHQRKVQDTR